MNVPIKRKIAYIAITLLISLVIVEISLKLIERIVYTSRIKSLEETLKEVAQHNPYRNIEIYKDRVPQARKFYNDLKKLRLAYRPYVERRRIPNQHLANIHINDWGYRGTEFTFRKPKQVFRIIIFGGSFVWGTGAIYDDETISGHLEKLLNQNYINKRFEVINGGETGFVLTQERILFIEEAIFFSPDLVIFIDGVNDLWAAHNNLPAGFPIHYKAFNERLSINYKKPIKETLRGQIKFLENQLRINWQALRRLTTVDAIKSFIRNATIDNYHPEYQLAAKHLHNAEIINIISKARGIDCVFGLQSILYLDKPLSIEEAKTEKLSTAIYPGFPEFAKTVYPKYRDILADAMKERKLHFCDFMNAFSIDSSTRYIDHFHLNGEGYRIIAEKLLEFLKKQKFFEQ